MEILYWILDKIITAIPGRLLQILYPLEKLSSQVRIRLRGEKPITPSLNSSVPHVDLYLEISNMSNIDLELDRLIIDLWFGQPVLNGVVLDPKLVKAKTNDCQIFFRSFLSTYQVRQIEPYLSSRIESGSITLTTLAYFNSKIGQVEKKQKFERRTL